ncbi:hypothetical protein ACHAWF_004953 [Thalassiosira exigua]
MILLLVVAMSHCRLTLAFSHGQIRSSGRRQFSTSVVFTRVLEPFSTDTKNEIHSFNPLGPPEHLSKLSVGGNLSLHGKNITRLSSSPDMFLAKELISEEDREVLMQIQGMQVAGTRQSGDNTVRKNSYLAWIDPYSFSKSDEESDRRDAQEVAKGTILKARLCFAHEVMNEMIDDVKDINTASAEDLQVAKYDMNGSFDYHHDGYSRYMTVLTYLNGVGGTYFPFAGMTELDDIDFSNENEVSVLNFKKQFDQCGILIVGEEGADAYPAFVKPKAIVQIEAGDAIAFYNYMPGGEKDLRLLHAALPVQREKWIATSWLRSQALTGPFASWKKAQLFESWQHC